MKEKCPTCFLVFREKNLKRIVPVKTKTDIFALEIINYIFSQNTDNIVLYLTIQCLSSFNLLPSLFS
jgi:hypothetical protein